jgi:uncharacterized SAM-dependent methyltransferase
MDKPLVTNRALLADALAGLRARPKRMHPKWFYDRGQRTLRADHGAAGILSRRAPSSRSSAARWGARGRVPEGAALVELGSGASTKTRVLLDALGGLGAYVPIDVSGDFLGRGRARSGPRLSGPPRRTAGGRFPWLTSNCRTEVRDLPKVAFFPGSTIGNLDPEEARDLLRASGRGPGSRPSSSASIW